MFTLSFLLVTHFSFTSQAAPYGIRNIVIKSFQAVADGKTAKLSWDLAEMDHEVTCYLQRSEDGSVFNTIETFTIKEGFRGVMRTMDKLSAPGQYYYRLHISKPGFIPYVSGIVSVRINAEAEATTTNATGYQVMNPFRDQLTVKGKFGKGSLRVEISDMNGRVRLVQHLDGPANSNRINIGTSQLDKGAYILRVLQNEGNAQNLLMTKRIIKND